MQTDETITIPKAKVISEVDALKASLQEMLDAYWGEGDGEPAPAFILRAQLLLAE